MQGTGKFIGGCLCGEIRYQADAPPIRVGYCHCRMCQQGVGNIFGTAALFRHETFRFVTGRPTWFQSSALVKRGFCARCGSPIAYQHSDNQHIAIWVGTLDYPEKVQPQVHWHIESKIAWVNLDTSLPDATTELASHRRQIKDQD